MLYIPVNNLSVFVCFVLFICVMLYISANNLSVFVCFVLFICVMLYIPVNNLSVFVLFCFVYLCDALHSSQQSFSLCFVLFFV